MSVSIFLAIASPNNFPMSATTLDADAMIERSETVALKPTSDTVKVTPSVEIAVAVGAVASVIAAAVWLG